MDNTTYNQGNVISEQVPRLSESNLGMLVDNIQGVDANMTSGVILDNTYNSHQGYRFIPSTISKNSIMFQFTLPNWCYSRDVSLNLQYIFRLGGESDYTPGVGLNASQVWYHDPIWSTAQLITDGGYHITNGGLLSIFRNMKIKLGNQVDIMTAFEKTKCGFHILNTWLRGKWDQKNTFALIDRWDAWYPYNSARTFTSQQSVSNNPFNIYYSKNTNPIDAQSDCIFERHLSRILAQKGLLRENDNDPVNKTRNGPDRFNEFVENVSISLDKLHSVFQQNILLPPGLQFILEFECPIYNNYNFEATSFPKDALWGQIGHVQCIYDNNMVYPNPTPDDLQFRKIEEFTNQLLILTSINATSTFNSIHANCVNMKTEIGRALQDKRIEKPLIYNYNQMVATKVGNYFAGQTVYNFSLPPNQNIASQLLFAWVNPIAVTSLTTAYIGTPNKPLSSYQFGNYEMQFVSAPPGNIGPYAFDGPATDAYAMGLNQVPHAASSLTPLPVPFKRIIISRGGFREVTIYGTYYDGFEGTGFSTSSGVVNTRQLQNACVLYRAQNLTPSSTQHYYDHLEEYQWRKINLNGERGERRMRFSGADGKQFANGKWMCVQMNPSYTDLGQYSGDQANYTLDITVELDMSITTSEQRSFLVDNLTEFVCVRVLPAQLSIAIDGTVKQYVWPNLLVDPNAVVSQNAPSAGPGGSV
jgi:hypothetical protein